MWALLIYGVPVLAVVALLLRNKYLVLLAAGLSLPVAWYFTHSPSMTLRLLALLIPAGLVVGGYLIHKQKFSMAYVALVPIALTFLSVIVVGSDWPEHSGQPQAIQQ